MKNYTNDSMRMLTAAGHTTKCLKRGGGKKQTNKTKHVSRP